MSRRAVALLFVVWAMVIVIAVGFGTPTANDVIAQPNRDITHAVLPRIKADWMEPQQVGPKGQPILPDDRTYTIPEKVGWAIKFLEKFPDPRDIRMVDISAIPQKTRSTYLRTLAFWINNLHLEPSVTHLRPVPDSNYLLWWFYLEEFGWNADTWERVADREPYYREPWVPPPQAQVVRSRLGTRQTSAFSLQLIVRADWLYRDSVDQTRSDTYTDLLFAKFQGGSQGVDSWREETVLVKHPGGDYLYPDDTRRIIKGVEPGDYTVHLKFRVKAGSQKAAVKFPKNLDDIDKVFGIDLIDQFIARSGIDPSQGAVVDEGASLVARQNRLLLTKQSPVKLGAKTHRTFDVTVTAGDRDFTEKRNKNFTFDFNEIFWTTPAGAQAMALADAKKNLLAKGDSDIVHNTNEFTRRLPRATVVNPISCVDCHEKGLIVPNNHLADLRKAGIKVNFLDKRAALADEAFFFSDYEQQLKNDQDSYITFIKKTSGFEPAQNSRHVVEFAKWYDSQVSIDQAAVELGTTVDMLKLILIDGLKHPILPDVVVKTPKARLNGLATGIPIPRPIWEATAFQECALLLKAAGK
jgi:hypothetical protein